MKTLNSRKVCKIIKVVSMATLVAACSQPLFLTGATLTGACLFDVDASGNGTGIEVWNTTAEEDRWNLWITTSRPGDNPDGLTTPFINGPNDSSATIALPLQQGFNRFTIYGETSDAKPAYGLNLFFGGRSFPGISALALLRTNGVVPAFQLNAAPTTYGLDEFPIPGAGSLSCADGDDVITLVEFHWASPEVYNRDRVSVDFTDPSGQPDFIGTFTLMVGPPNPGDPKPASASRKWRSAGLRSSTDSIRCNIEPCWEQALGTILAVPCAPPEPANACRIVPSIRRDGSIGWWNFPRPEPA